MPRDGQGIYSKRAGTTAIANTEIESAKYNAAMDDLVDDLNAIRPIASGGTGAANIGDARTNLDVYAKADVYTKTQADTNAALKAPLASPALTGTPTAPTATAGTNTTQIATTAFVNTTALASPALTGVPTAPTATAGTNTTQIATTAFAQTAIASAVPAGAVVSFPMNTPPTGWIKANGAKLSRTTYAALFAAIGTTYGAGDGSTTFVIPDYRGEFLRGWDDGRGIDASRALGSFQNHALQNHTHRYNLAVNQGGTASGPAGAFFYAYTTQDTSGVTNGNSAAETRPRNVSSLFCIKY